MCTFLVQMRVLIHYKPPYSKEVRFQASFLLENVQIKVLLILSLLIHLKLFAKKCMFFIFVQFCILKYDILGMLLFLHLISSYDLSRFAFFVLYFIACSKGLFAAVFVLNKSEIQMECYVVIQFKR